MQDWTNEEIKILLDNIKLPNKKIHELFFPYRTPASIKYKIKQLGKTKEIRHRWTDEEKELLFNNLDKTMPELIEMFYGRFNKNSIMSQLFKKGVTCRNSRTDLWTEEECEILKNNYYLGMKRLLELLPNKTNNGIWNHSRILSLNIPYIIDWQYEEIELLKSLCDGTRTYDDLQKCFPNKTIKQINGKCKKLNINNLVKKRIDYWSEDEYNYLINNYNILSISEIIDYLGRTINAIETKASKLKLTNNTSQSWTQEEIDLLYELHKNKIDRSTVFEVFNYRTYPSVKGQIKKLKLRFHNDYIGADGETKLDSLEEKKAFNYIYNTYDTNISKYYRSTYDLKFGNDFEKYIPDFIIFKISNIKLIKPLIIEYYGYCTDNMVYKPIQIYKEKMLRKNQHYKSRNDIYFIDLYPEDLKNNCQGIRNKLNNFINKLNEMQSYYNYNSVNNIAL